MNKEIIISVVLICSLIFILLYFFMPRTPQLSMNASPIRVSSPVFDHNGSIPAKYTCDGAGIIPPLSFVPTGTTTPTSFVLIMDDPDAPGGTFTHWIKFNLLPTIFNTEEGKDPQGGTGINSGQSADYFPPCPPQGTHRYVFTVYSLDTRLSVEKAPDRREIERLIDGHIIGTGQLIGTYSRSAAPTAK